jgi:hypothetical protein
MDMKKSANTTLMMAMSFMTMLSAGPDVSLVADSVTHNSAGVGSRLLPSVEALSAVNRHDGLITRHDLDVAGLVRLLNVRQPLLDGDLALRRPDAHLLRHASVAVVALSSIPPLSLIDRAPVPERKPPVELALLGILLGIVPSTSSVGHGDGELHRGGDRTREKASNGLQQHKQTQGTAENCVRNGFAVSPCWRALGWSSKHILCIEADKFGDRRG